MFLAAPLLSLCWEFITRHPGLVLVLIGVAGEVACDWNEMSGRLARAKKLSAILLVVGLAIEFVEAAKSDLEIATLNKEAANARLETAKLEEQIAETRTNVANVDPRNAPISQMTATAYFVIMGTNFNELSNTEINRKAEMSLWKDERLGTTLDPLIAEKENITGFIITPIFGTRDRRTYRIQFHSFNFNAAKGFEYPVKTIDDVHIVHIDLNFLPRDTEIAGGRVELVMNSLHKMFDIPKQNDTNSNMGWQSGFPCWFVATNGVQTSEKQFLYLHE